jgi:TRAP-type uncharacterized transport system substrate-binding protein
MKYVYLVLAFCVLSLSTAYAAGPVFAGGKEGGSYIRYATNLASIVSENKHFQKEPPTVMETGGSKDNLEALNGGTADAAPTQSDAFMLYLKKNPSAEARVESVGILPTEECLFIVTRDSGSVTSASDLEKKTARIAVGADGSGTALTWEYIKTLHPAYAAQVTNKDGNRTFGKLPTGGDHGIDAYAFVSAANVDSDIFDAVNKPNSHLKFIDFNDSDLKVKLPNGEPVYVMRDVPTLYKQNRSFTHSGKVTVPCMKTLISIRSDIDDKLADVISKAVTLNAGRVAGTSATGNKIDADFKQE